MPLPCVAFGTADRSLKIEQQVMSTPLKCTLAVFLVFAYLQTFDVTATLSLYVTFSIERR